MTNLPKIDPKNIIYHEEPTWYLTRCESKKCKQLWYFSHEIESIIHNDDNTHTITYQGITLQQNI